MVGKQFFFPTFLSNAPFIFNNFFMKVLHIFLPMWNAAIYLQRRCLGSCGNWSHCRKKGRANGEEKWTGCSLLPTIWLNWFPLSNMAQMAGLSRYSHFFSDCIFFYMPQCANTAQNRDEINWLLSMFNIFA